MACCLSTSSHYINQCNIPIGPQHNRLNEIAFETASFSFFKEMHALMSSAKYLILFRLQCVKSKGSATLNKEITIHEIKLWTPDLHHHLHGRCYPVFSCFTRTTPASCLIGKWWCEGSCSGGRNPAAGGCVYGSSSGGSVLTCFLSCSSLAFSE